MIQHKKCFLSLLVSFSMIFSTINFVWADTEIPEQPACENSEDNQAIEEYNKEAEEYNNKVDEYNKQVDEDYEQATKEVEEQNQKIQEHNDAENERVEKEIAENEKIKEENEQKKEQAESNKQENEKRKAEANAENEKRKVEAEQKAEEENKQIDSEYEQALNDYNAILEYNKQAEEHNQNVAKIKEENEAEQTRVDTINKELKDKYDKDYAIYQEKVTPKENPKIPKYTQVTENKNTFYYDADNNLTMKAVAGNTAKDDIITYENIGTNEDPKWSNTYDYKDKNNKRYVNFSLVYMVGKTTTGTDWDNDASKYSNKVFATMANLNDVLERPLDPSDLGEGRNLINYKTNNMGLEACDNMIRAIAETPISNYFNENNGNKENGRAESMISFKDFPSDAEVFTSLQTNGSVFIDPDTGEQITGTAINSNDYDICWFSVKYQSNGWRVNGVLLKKGVIVPPAIPAYEQPNLQSVPDEIELKEDPGAPIKRGYVKAIYDLYTPELLDEAYEETAIKEIVPADLWNLLPAPNKRAYLNYISLLNLISDPIIDQNENNPIINQAKGNPIINQAENNSINQNENNSINNQDENKNNNSNFIISKNGFSALTQDQNNSNTSNKKSRNNLINFDQTVLDENYINTNPSEEITELKTLDDNEVPLSINRNNPTKQYYWALLNLILALVTLILGFISLILFKRKKDGYKIYNHKKFKILSAAVGVVSVIIFILTENMNNSWIWTDCWTPVMIIALIIEVISFSLSVSEKEKLEKN